MLKKMGKYELIEQVGRGAMGEVYKAQDPFIGRLVALKTITGALTGRPDLLERFYQEARSAGTLQHPNIVTVYELGKEGETPFIAMEFIEGESLESMIERRPVLTLTQKVSYIIPVCRALDYAHKRGVVHRDIKPGNVMITKEGGVKVVDFGIARLMDSSHTQTNTIIGTLGYMSPQQIRGERADERSDIWACGVMLYELLTFQRPFDGANQTALMLNIAS
jgi:serine/threonine protein kinase